MSVVKKLTANKNSKISRTKQNKSMLLSYWAVFGKKKSRFIKNQETSRSLNKLGIRTPLIFH